MIRADSPRARQAGFTDSAGDERLDRNAIAGPDAPAKSRSLTDLIDDAERLMARNERVLNNLKMTVVKLDIRSADPACLDSEDRLIRPDPRPRKRLQLDHGWRRLYCGRDHLRFRN
jgi:hypothetical protein